MKKIFQGNSNHLLPFVDEILLLHAETKPQPQIQILATTTQEQHKGLPAAISVGDTQQNQQKKN